MGPGTICGVNSICQNNAQCLCVSGYFSPSGSQTDCKSLTGMAIFMLKLDQPLQYLLCILLVYTTWNFSTASL